jgi:hypothetical protein
MTREEILSVLARHINEGWTKIQDHSDYVAFHGGKGIFLPYLRNQLGYVFKPIFNYQIRDPRNRKTAISTQINDFCRSEVWELDDKPKYKPDSAYICYEYFSGKEINALICDEASLGMKPFLHTRSTLDALLKSYTQELSNAENIGNNIVKLLSE